jgi:hypothetical protein
VRRRIERERPLVVLALVVVSLCASAVMPQSASAQSGEPAESPTIGTIVPAGAHVRFRLDAPLSSMQSSTGQHFTFTLLDPIQLGGSPVANAGARGNGTVLLAGHAGAGGHEGDLTLRVDYVQTPNRYELFFNDGRFEVNGTNHKIASGVLGFVPYAGLGAHFIRGREIVIGTDTPVLFVSTRPVTVMSEADAEFLRPAVVVYPGPKATTTPTPVVTTPP